MGAGLFRYRILTLLGCGSFGQVVKARNTRTGRLFAVKVIKARPQFRKQGDVEVAVLRLVRPSLNDLGASSSAVSVMAQFEPRSEHTLSWPPT